MHQVGPAGIAAVAVALLTPLTSNFKSFVTLARILRPSLHRYDETIDFDTHTFLRIS